MYSQVEGQAPKIVGSYKYQKANYIGLGTNGEVYKCTNVQTNEELAIKILPNPQFQIPKELNLEINNMLTLKGSNTVKLHQVLQTENNIYQVMELCDSNLETYLNKYKLANGKAIVTEAEAIQIITDILKGFQELIENGILHRDIKPSNILVKNGTYKISDYCSALLVDELKMQVFHRNFQTSFYKSVQALEGQECTIKSNIWSIGCIFYNLLYGTTPWIGNSDIALIQNIRKQDFEFLDHINQVSDSVKDVIKKCLTKNEEDRISWIELFQHPVFGNSVLQMPNKQQIGQRKKISLEELKKDVNLVSELNEGSLEVQLKKILKDFTRIEAQYILQQIKINNKQILNHKDFFSWLEKLVGLSSCLLILKMVMKKYNQNLQQYYDKFNKSKDGKLKFEEFQLLIKKISELSIESEILESFQLIDKNQSGFITIQEFQQVLDNLQIQ